MLSAVLRTTSANSLAIIYTSTYLVLSEPNPWSYLLLDQLKEGMASLDLHVLAIGLHSFQQNWDDLSLHLNVIFEDVDCIEKYIAILHWILFVQQQFDAFTFSQVFLDREAEDLLFWL